MRKFFVVIFCMLIFSAYRFDIDVTNNAVSHNAMGLEYMKMGNVYAAISEFQLAIALKEEGSNSSAYHNNLGLAYMRLGYPKWAEICFENAIKLNPNNIYFYENLLKTYEMQNKLALKSAYYQKKAKENFENSFNWLMLGLIQEKRHDYKNAINSFKNYILLEPEIVISRTVKTKIDNMKKYRL